MAEAMPPTYANPDHKHATHSHAIPTCGIEAVPRSAYDGPVSSGKAPAPMALVPVSEGNVDAFVAFLAEHGDEEGRAYMAKVDMRRAVLWRGGDFLWIEAGRPAATLTVHRAPRPDGGQVVSLCILPEGGRAGALMACLGEFLAGEEGTAAARCYRLAELPHMAFPEADLAAAGFARRPGRCKYARDPGPPRPGEFPLADRALARGYTVVLASEAMIGAEPALGARLTDIHNRAFAGRPGVARRDEAEMLGRLTLTGGGTLVALRDGQPTGYLAFVPMDGEVLVTELASLRPHWGTGSADLMCRHVATLVAKRWGVSIVGYADAANAPSRRAMERAGMRRVADYPVWEHGVEAGQGIARPVVR